MRSYSDIFDIDIPEIIKDCSEKDWDSYGAEPVSLGALEKAKVLLDRMSELNLPPPDISPCPDGDIDLAWSWSKGDWRISLDKQERYSWYIVLEVSLNNMDNKGDCLFLSHDAREGVSKHKAKVHSLYFNSVNDFPKEMLDMIKEWEKHAAGE